MIRAFIAIDLPDDVRDSIRNAQAQMRQAIGAMVSWAKVGNLHLTLQFLGNVKEDAVGRISAGLAGIAGDHAPFELAVAGAGAFPDEQRPRVLWVGCADDKLTALAKSVHAAMQPLGFQPEQREFSAHLTLGRVKRPRPDVALTRALESIKNQSFGVMRVDAIHLFQSQLHPDGSIYSKLSSHQLGERHHATES